MTSPRKNLWIGLALVVAGLAPAGFLAHAVWNWSRARSWLPTPARVISVDVAPRSTGRTKSSIELMVEYEYTWDGATFQNSVFSPFCGIEVFDSYTKRQRSVLDRAVAEQKAVTCFVDPAHPSRACLNRDFRWGSFLLFSAGALIFSGCGALVVRQYYCAGRIRL